MPVMYNKIFSIYNMNNNKHYQSLADFTGGDVSEKHNRHDNTHTSQPPPPRGECFCVGILYKIVRARVLVVHRLQI